MSMPRASCFLLLSLLSWIPSSLSQPPTAEWTPNFQPLGLYCYHDAPDPNIPPHSHQHSGGCGCENTQFRWTDGELYLMESHGHDCDAVFSGIGYNKTRDGDCSYFRIRHMITGRVIANVSESLRHSFFSAVVDYSATPSPILWVFGPAHARGNKLKPGPCDGDGNWTGCYIGAWSSSDLVHWSRVEKAVPIPDHHAAFNTRVSIVTRQTDAAAMILPAHQAVMVLEPRNDYDFRFQSFRYAINLGTDGDLSRDWQLLPSSNFSESGPGFPPGGLNLGAPTVHYDHEEGYYYTIGGGSITAGPVRSKTLASGSWEISPLAPMAAPAAALAAAGLNATDARVYRGFFKDVWALETQSDALNIAAFIDNISSWNYGVTDPDLCCSDGKAPSYKLHTVSQQGKPHNVTGKTTTFAALEEYPGTLNEWLRSYFP